MGTKLDMMGKQKALKSCDFKAFCWWGKVDSLFLRKKPRRLQRATGTLLILESVKKLEELFIAPTARQILHETAQRAFARCECA